MTASWFYRLLGRVAQIEVEQNAGDFRLLSRRALDALLAMPERNRYIRGMTAWVGFTQTSVPYQRAARHAGETKFSLFKMLRFSFDAIASFSYVPLQLATLLGFFFAAVAFLGIPVAIAFRIAGEFVPGVTTTVIAVLLLGGIQLMAIGIIGEYLARVYDEVKRRPLYLVQSKAELRPRRRPVRVAVIGAGVAGLVAGHRLAEAGHACDVYERWPGLGGQAATLDVGQGHLLERYYHHLFTSDRHIAELYDELGMPDELEWRPSSVAFFADGRSWPFNGPLDLLRFRPLSLASRLRMGIAVVLLQRRAPRRAPFESETAHEWVLRAMGRQAWEKVWGPLLRGKFGDRATRHLDVVAVEQAHRPAPDQGRGGAPGAARLPARELGDAVRAAQGVDRVRAAAAC